MNYRDGSVNIEFIYGNVAVCFFLETFQKSLFFIGSGQKQGAEISRRKMLSCMSWLEIKSDQLLFILEIMRTAHVEIKHCLIQKNGL